MFQAGKKKKRQGSAQVLVATVFEKHEKICETGEV